MLNILEPVQKPTVSEKKPDSKTEVKDTATASQKPREFSSEFTLDTTFLTFPWHVDSGFKMKRCPTRSTEPVSVRSDLVTKCETCGTTGPVMKCCLQCKSAYYCSKACQQAGWVRHRFDCSVPGSFDVQTSEISKNISSNTDKESSSMDGASNTSQSYDEKTSKSGKSQASNNTASSFSQGSEKKSRNASKSNVAAPKAEKIKICAKCGIDNKIKKVKSCKDCKKVYYCSVQCQRADWNVHKGVCILLR